MEQPGGGEQKVGALGFTSVFQEEPGIRISLFRRHLKPAVCLFPVLLHIFSHEIQLTQNVLSERAALFSRGGQVPQRFRRIFGNQLSLKIQFSQPISGSRIPLSCRFFVPGDCFLCPLLRFQQPAQSVLREIITGFGAAAKPQLRLFIIREYSQSIPPAPAQLVSCRRETIFPELFQCLHLFCLLGFCPVPP